MKKSLKHLPSAKQAELRTLTELIQQHAPDSMVILFGSYARGDWVEDPMPVEGQFYYQSDFDVLIIVNTRSLSAQEQIAQTIETAIEHTPAIKTPVSVIVDDIHFINSQLSKRQYFFADIKCEGILLYNAGLFTLARIKRLSKRDRYQLAKEDFDYWYQSALEFMVSFGETFERASYNLAAFLLHQATERFYATVLLVFTRYKPRTHDIKQLRKLANALDSRFAKNFPLITPEEKRLFKLLRKAYVDARYNKTYRITAEELTALAQQVQAFQRLTEMLCQEKIKAFFNALTS